MANEAQITVVGNLGADPEFRITSTGKSLTTFNIAVTPSKQVNGVWEDGETAWYRVFVWGKKASGVADAFSKGGKALVYGKLLPVTFTDKEGQERRALEIHADEVGVVPRILPDLPIANPENRNVEDPVAVEEYPW